MSLENNIVRTLSVSSAHVPWERFASDINRAQGYGRDRKVFWAKSGQPLTINIEESAWRAAVWSDNVEAAAALSSEDEAFAPIATLMRIAAESNCVYLEIDGDAAALPEALGLPLYDWPG